MTDLGGKDIIPVSEAKENSLLEVRAMEQVKNAELENQEFQHSL
jgi:hypothetical protein